MTRTLSTTPFGKYSFGKGEKYQVSITWRPSSIVRMFCTAAGQHPQRGSARPRSQACVAIASHHLPPPDPKTREEGKPKAKPDGGRRGRK